MADRYWIASSAGNWSDTANWSTTSGGSGGASVPGSSDRVIFDSNGNGNSFVNNNYTVNEVDITSGYTETLIIEDSRLLITPTFGAASGASVILENPLSRIWITSHLNDIGANFSGTGHILLRADSGQTISIAGGTTNSNFVIQANSTGSIVRLTGNLTISGDVDIRRTNGDGTLDLATNNVDLTLQGNLIWTATTSFAWSKGTGTITLSGTAAQSIDFNGESVEDIVVDKSSGTATLAGAVTTDSLAVDRGTFDINGQAVNVIGNVTANPIAGNFSFQDSVGTGTLSISGNINLNGTPTFGGIWTDVDIVALAAGANDASYCEISNSNNSSGNDIDATNNCVDNGGNIGWVFAGAPAVDVNPVTELIEIITPPVTVQYFPFINVDVQTETLLISTPPVNVEVFEDITVIPATQFLNIITPPVDVNIGFDVDVNPLTEFLDIATPQVDVKTPVEFLIATEAQPLQYQVAVGGIVQMRAQLNVNAWRNENNWVSTPFPAVISTQPVGGSVVPGGAVSLSVTAIGAASYQWYLDGAALIGETGSTLNTTAPVIPGDYDYTCLALNADGFGIRSDAATVTVS